MRETTRLLCAHMIEPLALMVESYIMFHAKILDGLRGEDRLSHVVEAGHWEAMMSEYEVAAKSDFRREHFGLCGACAGGNLDMAKYMISCGANTAGVLNKAIYIAAVRDNEVVPHPVIELLLAHGANINDALNGAARFGKLVLCRWLLARCGVDANGEYPTIISSTLLEGGCVSGNMEIIHLAISIGATNFGSGVWYAARLGKRAALVLMMNLCPDRYSGIIFAFYGACDGDQQKIAEYILNRHYSVIGTRILNCGLGYACKEGNAKTLKFLISRGANACECGHSMKHHIRMTDLELATP